MKWEMCLGREGHGQRQTPGHPLSRLSPRTSLLPEVYLETGVSPWSLHYAQHGCTSEEIPSGRAQALART